MSEDVFMVVTDGQSTSDRWRDSASRRKIVDYALRHGRPLEQARLARYLEPGNSRHATRVIQELARFQNADGGFGRALEPDFRVDASSVVATTTAFHILSECLNSDSSPVGTSTIPDYASDMVRTALDWLLAAGDLDNACWPIVPPEQQDMPHAPWWDYAQTESAFGGFVLNPSAACVAYVIRFGDESMRRRAEPMVGLILGNLDGIKITSDAYKCLLELLDSLAAQPSGTVLAKHGIVLYDFLAASVETLRTEVLRPTGHGSGAFPKPGRPRNANGAA